MAIRQMVSAMLGLALMGAPAFAQITDYPNRTVTIVAPAAPGGLYSVFARLVGMRLEQRLGKSFVVENRPGAGSVIGATSVARAVPDGYTLMIGNSTGLASAVTLHKHLPYDPVNDFAHISLIATVPEVLIVPVTSPVHSLADLKRLAQDSKDPVTFASAGPGTAQHFEGETLSAELGVPMTHVPYKGALPALNDVLAGHITFMFSPIANALPLIEGGKLRPLGIASNERFEALPGVAPLAEQGVKGFDLPSWFMLVAPGKTPKEIVDRLHAEMRAIVGDPEMRREFVRQGLVPLDSPSPEKLREFVRTEVGRWAEAVRRAGLAGSE
jgi:tripartite-type tricarboxylate transporter receptor subunit TctC